MKFTSVVVCGMCGLNLLGVAAPDHVVLAAMRLGEQSSYSWTTAVSDDARSYAIEGRTRVGGYTWVRLPMVPEIAQRLGRSAEVDIEAVFDGPLRAVIRTDHGWRTLQELPERHREWNGRPVAWGGARASRPRVPGPVWGNSGYSSDPFAPAVSILPAGAGRPTGRMKPRSNAQFGLALPHDELAIIVSGHARMEVSGGVATGELTEVGARLLLVREGQAHISPVAAAGTFRLQIVGGVVVRYELRLEGILNVGGETVPVRQVSSTVVTKIGETQLALPDEAVARLAMTNDRWPMTND